MSKSFVKYKYESMGFVKKKNGNILTAFWKINDFECDAT